MADPGALRARLGELARARRSRMSVDADGGGAAPGAAAEAAAPDAAPGSAGAVASRRRKVPPGFSSPAVGVEEFLPGGEWRDSPDFTGKPGAVFVHERLRSQIEKRRPHWGRVESPPAHEPDLVWLATHGLEHALFLDLETCGLASSTVFLAGCMHWNGGDFVLRQYFARHYGEEGPLLRALHEAMSGFEYLVTFNGKTFDVPVLLGRAVVHGVRLAVPPRHLDLLHVARRRWKGELADCRLKTIESRVCRRHRVGDVPGEEVPGLYHDYVKNGDPYRLVPVFHHNLLDVITMSEILRALCGAQARGTRARPDDGGA
jgi:uncharacterized protein YprB with RNaseH-like and TPR domain